VICCKSAWSRCEIVTFPLPSQSRCSTARFPTLLKALPWSARRLGSKAHCVSRLPSGRFGCVVRGRHVFPVFLGGRQMALHKLQPASHLAGSVVGRSLAFVHLHKLNWQAIRFFRVSRTRYHLLLMHSAERTQTNKLSVNPMIYAPLLYVQLTRSVGDFTRLLLTPLSLPS
jgi:hypothetical protein